MPPSNSSIRESTYQRGLIERLRQIPNSKFFVKEAKSIRGISDIIGCINGKFIALEVKRNKAEASKQTGRIVLQRYFLSEITNTQGFGAFVYPENEAEILEILYAFSKEKI